MGTPDLAKKRILPPWMTKRVAEPAGLTEAKAKSRRKAALPRTETIYCMNEAELVDMALCILAEDCKGKETEIVAAEDEAPKLQQVPTDPQPRAVSCKKAEITTLRSKIPNKLETLDCTEKMKSDEDNKEEEDDDDDDDALKYVREIFFS